MAINAENKFLDAIDSNLDNFSERRTKILLPSELFAILEMDHNSQFGNYSFKNLNKEYYLVKIEGIETVFNDSFIHLTISIKARSKKSLSFCSFIQTIITTDYKLVPKINIITKTNFKAIQQLLTRRESSDYNFKNKDITIKDTKVCIDNYNAEFSCIKNIDPDKLLLESYVHNSPKSYISPFLMFCEGKKLNVIYDDLENPVFCQFDRNKNIERFDIDPNEPTDCKDVVSQINAEIDYYVNYIHTFFDEQKKRYSKSIKKKIKE